MSGQLSVNLIENWPINCTNLPKHIPEAPAQYMEIAYAHIEVLVTFLLVNFFGLGVVTRDHGSFEGRH